MADEPPLRLLQPFDDEPTPVDARAAAAAADEAIRQSTIEQLRRRIADLEFENAHREYENAGLQRENEQLKLELRSRLTKPAVEK